MYKPDAEIEKREIIQRYRNILKVWYTKKTEKDMQLVRKAFDVAVEAHKDMRRRSGEPYIYHPLDVARIAAEDIGLGTTSIVCALLHDVVEDTDYSIKDIDGLFGEKVAKIIDGLTKIEDIFDHSSLSRQAENFKKMLNTLSEDVRVILIKLADRLHNMRTLGAMPHEKQMKICSETRILYAPLAYRLGLFAIKSELEDLVLKYTEPDIYQTICKKLINARKERVKFTNKFVAPIKKAFEKNGIKAGIEIKEKSIFSIWQKMKNNEIPFEDIYDVFVVRVIIDTSTEKERSSCWKAYSLITDFYRPKHDKLHDWISFPKANGYESLHSTFMSETGKWVEVQIRTVRMNEIAEKGYAAHWKYKNADEDESSLDEWLRKVRELLQGNDSDAIDFLTDFKLNLFSDEIFVYTPKGELKSLPLGSTILDFAYNIHTQIGDKCIGGKINHELVPLKHVLTSGDQIEIITSKKQTPNEDWLDFVITARAKSSINDSIKENRKKYKSQGVKKLIEYFDELHIEYSRSNIKKLQKDTEYPSSIDLYYFVAFDKINLKDIKNSFQIEDRTLFGYKLPFSKSKKLKSLNETINEKIRNKPSSLILKTDVNNLKYIIADCCNPIPGDDVIGYFDGKDSIFVHRTNCLQASKLMSSYGDRIVKAKWEREKLISFLAGIKISAVDNMGLINNISKIIFQEFSSNIRSFHLETSEGVTNAIIMIYVHDTKNLNNIIKKLRKIKEIKKISRIDRFSETIL